MSATRMSEDSFKAFHAEHATGSLAAFIDRMRPHVQAYYKAYPLWFRIARVIRRWL